MRYKKVTFTTDQDFNEAYQKSIASFLNRFGNHIYFETDEKGRINLFVNNLDFNRFKLRAAELKTTQKGNALPDILDDFVAAIDGIRSYGLQSGRRVYVDYNKERKVLNRQAKSAKRRSTKLPKPVGWNTNPFPAQYENKIICDDSLEVLKKLPNNCIDLMITSPPYNFGLEYTEGEDDKNWDDYFHQLFRILNETYRVLKLGGRMVINVQPLFSDYIPTHHIISKHLLDKGMLWKGEIIWEKNNYNCKYTAWGSWKSPSSPYLKYTWEFIEVFCKGSLKHEGAKENIDISAEEFKKWVFAKWTMTPERKMKEYGHPAMFPEVLVERCLKLFSFRNDMVLDPFNGAGTTTYVAQELGRKYLGIDISGKYCDLARKRLSNS